MERTSAHESVVVNGVASELPIPASATTSRALIDNDHVRVVMFAFDAGEELTEHTASVPVVVQLIEGSMQFDVAGERHPLSPGDCVYLAPGARHALRAVEPSLMSLVMVRGATSAQLNAGSVPPPTSG